MGWLGIYSTTSCRNLLYHRLCLGAKLCLASGLLLGFFGGLPSSTPPLGSVLVCHYLFTLLRERVRTLGLFGLYPHGFDLSFRMRELLCELLYLCRLVDTPIDQDSNRGAGVTSSTPSVWAPWRGRTAATS